MIISSFYSQKWQATKGPGEASRRAGASCLQRSQALGQRVWKQQPAGGDKGLGTSPESSPDILGTSGSAMGMACSSALV